MTNYSWRTLREHFECAISSTRSRAREKALAKQLVQLTEAEELDECHRLRRIKRQQHRRGVAFTVTVWRAA